MRRRTDPDEAPPLPPHGIAPPPAKDDDKPGAGALSALHKERELRKRYEAEAKAKAQADKAVDAVTPDPEPAPPRSMDEIEARMEELGFTAHFMREMQMFARVQHSAHNAKSPQGGLLEQRLQEFAANVETEKQNVLLQRGTVG